MTYHIVNATIISSHPNNLWFKILCLHVIDMTCLNFYYVSGYHNIYNQANECSVKVDVWICLISLTKTTETNCKIAISLFFLNVYNTVFTCSYLLHCIHALI